MDKTIGLQGRILALLTDVSDPLTAEVVGQALPDVSFEEVLATLEALVDEGTLDYDLFGFRRARRVKGTGRVARKARPQRPSNGTSDGAAKGGAPVDDAGTTGDDHVLFQDDEVASVRLGEEAARLLAGAEVTGVRGLVAWLCGASRDGSVSADVLGAVRSSLSRHSIAVPDTLDDAEVLALCDVSESLEFAFDVFGRLCSVADRMHEMGVDVEGRADSAEGDMRDPSCLPDAARQGTRQALDDLADHDYPLFPEAFVVCMAHAAVRRLGSGATAGEFRDAVLGMTEGSRDLVDACAARLVRSSGLAGADGTCSVSEGASWDDAARLVARSDERLTFDVVRRTLAPVRPSVLSWLEGAELAGRDRTLTRSYLQGQSLEQCGASWSLSPERVRQDVRRVLSLAPTVEEDRHRHLFETYGLTKAEFLEVTGAGVCAYAYLRATSDAAGTKPVAEAACDLRLDEDVREAIRGLIEWTVPAAVDDGAPTMPEQAEGQAATEGGEVPAGPVAVVEAKPEALEGFFSFRENQRGISYEMLFGPYFEGASRIRIVDPYVRAFHQCRNIMELMAVLVRHRDFSKPAPQVHLLTSRSDSEFMRQREFLGRLEIALASQDIVFTWECDLGRTIHARHIYVDDAWDIQLDRGLDFWQKFDSGDAFSFEAQIPETRRVRQFEITYRRLDGAAIA